MRLAAHQPGPADAGLQLGSHLHLINSKADTTLQDEMHEEKGLEASQATTARGLQAQN